MPLSPEPIQNEILEELVVVDENQLVDPDEVPDVDPEYPMPRRSNPSRWKRSIVKSLSNSGKAHTSLKGKQKEARSIGQGCTDKCKRKCMFMFSEEHRKSIFATFWADNQDRRMKWSYIASLVRTQNVKRRTIILNYGETPSRQNTYLYFLPLPDKSELQVCQKFFVDTLGVNRTWVRTAIAKKNSNQGAVTPDGRGKKSTVSVITASLKKGVMDHVKSFPVVDGHYNRKDSKSKYLPEELNRRIMHSMYTVEKQAEISKLKAEEAAAEAAGEDPPPGPRSKHIKIATLRQYRDIFKKEFNLKFFRQKKDQCGKCLSWKHKRPEERTGEARLKHEKHLSDKKLGDEKKKKTLTWLLTLRN